MSIEPELPYFPLPIEHERPTRRCGAYRADAIVVVEGSEWGFRFLEGNTYFTELPFIKGESKIFLFPSLPSETRDLEWFVNLTKRAGQNDSGFCRVVEANWNGTIVFLLGFDGSRRILCAGNGPFAEICKIQQYNEEGASEHAVPPRDLISSSNDELRKPIEDSTDFFVHLPLTLLRYPSQILYPYDNETSTIDIPSSEDPYKKSVYLASKGVISFSPRVQGEFTPEKIVNCCLMLEDGFGQEIADQHGDEPCYIVAEISTDSQFDPASCEFWIKGEYGYIDQVSELMFNRLVNLVDITLDELAMRGARFSQGRLEEFAAMPFMSIIVDVPPFKLLDPPTNTKRWKLSSN